MTDTIKFLTPAEIDRLFAVVTKPRDRAILRVAYHRGLRASEVGLLQVEDYRQREQRLLVHRLKGSHSGEHRVTVAESRALRDWLAIRGSAPGPLFPSNRGHAINRRTLDTMFKRYGALAGLPPDRRHLHVLKHSCATHLLSGHGVDVAEVQDHLGHADIRSTVIYAKITNARRDALAERLRNW